MFVSSCKPAQGTCCQNLCREQALKSARTGKVRSQGYTDGKRVEERHFRVTPTNKRGSALISCSKHQRSVLNRLQLANDHRLLDHAGRVVGHGLAENTNPTQINPCTTEISLRFRCAHYCKAASVHTHRIVQRVADVPALFQPPEGHVLRQDLLVPAAWKV